MQSPRMNDNFARSAEGHASQANPMLLSSASPPAIDDDVYPTTMNPITFRVIVSKTSVRVQSDIHSERVADVTKGMVIVAADRVKYRSAHRLRIPHLPDGRAGGWVTWKGEGEDRLALHDDNTMAAPKSTVLSPDETHAGDPQDASVAVLSTAALSAQNSTVASGCSSCGAQLEGSAKFCPGCGQTVTPANAQSDHLPDDGH